MGLIGCLKRVSQHGSHMKEWPQGLRSMLASFAHLRHSGKAAAPVGLAVAGRGGAASDVGGAVEDELLELVLVLVDGGTRERSKI